MRLRPLLHNDIKLLRRTIIFIKPFKFKLIILALTITTGISFTIFQPLIWAKVLEGLFTRKIVVLMKFLFIMLFFQLLEILVSHFRSNLSVQINNTMICDLKSKMLDKILNLPVKAYDDISIGTFMSRLQSDVTTVSNIITNQLLIAIIDILKVILIGAIALKINIILSFIVLLSFIISYIIFMKYGTILRQKEQVLKILFDEYFNNIQQTLAGIREIKSLGQKKRFLINGLENINSIKEQQVDISFIDINSNSLSNIANIISSFLVTILGGYFVCKDILSLTLFIAFTSYSRQFSFSLMNLTRLNSTIQQSMISLERIFETLDNYGYMDECFGNKKVDRIEGNIIFDNVSFSYNKSESVLHNVSFSIKKGELTAIVGKSGTGKSTIFNLLMRFYDQDKGSICIDNIEISEYNEESLRKHISIVPQEPFLFNKSIMDNLILANPIANVHDVYEACKKAYMHEYICSLPNGYKTIIGDNGILLSSGQKQRLAIARALLKKSKIILFDEATSDLDNESQFFIKKAVEEMISNHTIIMIAHRLSTIIDANKIIILDRGVVAQGNHRTLLKNNKLYRSLFLAEWGLTKDYLESGDKIIEC